MSACQGYYRLQSASSNYAGRAGHRRIRAELRGDQFHWHRWPNSEVNAAPADPTFEARITELGMQPFASSPAEFGKFLADYTEKWAR